MGLFQTMGNSCHSLHWTLRRSCSCSAACCLCVCTKRNGFPRALCRTCCPGCHPGFSVYAGPPVEASEIASLESQARYITRPVLAMDALEKLDDENLVLKTPPDPRTGATSIELDRLEWIHRITSHIRDPGRHCQRFYGAYSNRGRISVAVPEDETASLPAAGLSERDNSDVSREARSTWARLIRKIFETDPLLCSCGGRMRIVSCITDPRIAGRILRHRESGNCKSPDPFEPRSPPGATPKTPQ